MLSEVSYAGKLGVDRAWSDGAGVVCREVFAGVRELDTTGTALAGISPSLSITYDSEDES